jgi:hypothetical protein
VARFFLGIAIAATALGAAAPASAESDNPFGHLCMVGQCSTPAPTTVRHYDLSQLRAGIQDGLQFAPASSH